MHYQIRLTKDSIANKTPTSSLRPLKPRPLQADPIRHPRHPPLVPDSTPFRSTPSHSARARSATARASSRAYSARSACRSRTCAPSAATRARRGSASGRATARG
ncbi:hypothetical protein BV25DRAFT_593318 [Artomyces pyxidatus]|uniref:Uncharacterized protein n=1 Tax=Artomyces pyxidatus TaxID=48021 RepID=A0ACB8T1U1_9AGAM|nr:hypothetical protein BV25DRAFT_593318 [Artomyces pyxidatus]